MDSPDAQNVSSTPPPPLRRRYSMEEDIFYNQLMGGPKRRPSQPPPYRPTPTEADSRSTTSADVDEPPYIDDVGDDDGDDDDESPPRYQSTVSIEGVFSKKHEIEDTIKRAEDRQWHTVFVLLQGTALNVYSVKKDWGWGRTRDGPAVCPDNPPWVRRSKLEKSYSLLHADAGIAADYTKRRYVIRVRAETDQFLLSCIELSTFVKWLESLFAAIGVAAPIDDRDFPRDMSIPRIQRIRWFRGQSPALPGFAAATSAPETTDRRPATDGPSSVPPPTIPARPRTESGRRSQGPSTNIPPRLEPPRRLSTTTYPNASIDPHTGKWFPEHRWSSAHDLLYAKLCYSNLLFRSPRKSNYIISKGKQWVVDWGTGRMVRVLPPAYGEMDYFGPWQVIHTENFRI
ncbi:PH domain-containing protein [Ophiocordyceps camponoti-floridani]|uniref:PH domain-containing protein n=1 Tax=Ophiocordyceps camponoti-floridani TaxID=2030778 RepID=A0A8H4Q6X9_9HYPO|nr:PH domain-containing protein [Ophiocordyceps camponoti-floridani]